MDIYRKINRHTQFYVDSIDGVMKQPDQRPSEDKSKENEELEEKLLSITKRIVASAQQFQNRETTSTNHYLKKTQWLPYKNEELEQTKELFAMLTSIDKKIAQLFFYSPVCDSKWDEFTKVIHDLKESSGLGGILLYCGSFEQQCEYIRSINKKLDLPLLLGTTVVNSLHYYLTYRNISLVNYQNMSDLAEDLGNLLKQYGVAFTLIFKEIMHMDLLNYSKLVQVLKHSGNIQGCMYDSDVPIMPVSSCSPIALRYSLANTIRGLALHVDFSSLKFISPSIFSDIDYTAKVLNSGGECFIFTNLNEFNFGMKTIIQLVRTGKISPEILNKKIMKMLMIKRRLSSICTY
ncbi:hypothetical protein C10C_0273 [Chlamydia serpentis]|uniref:Uncharacterized protein n=1 Tax=Chlamydia serpentis TaxID=1967782 RepID=A0A2R8FB31_9CHLA|nr:hypothetical protein [Chlamydia serpentis]SPN73447.1 hypothetical protein C10C_0273 [Chlamydia serpentis]